MSDNIILLKRDYEDAVNLFNKHNGSYNRSELGAYLWKNLLEYLDKLEFRIKELESALIMEKK